MNSQKTLEYRRNWKRRNREKVNKYRRNACKKLKQAIFNKLGNVCKHCGFKDVRALQIDHVKGGGRKEVASLDTVQYLTKILKDTAGNYQILCANCNQIKVSENKESPRFS